MPLARLTEARLHPFDSLMSKLTSDPSFAASLVADPEGTLSAHGVEPTAEMVSAIRALDPAAIEKLVGAFGSAAAGAA